MPRSKAEKWLPRKVYRELKQESTKTKVPCSMLNISSDVLWSIFGEWISPNELCSLDLAYCNRKVRSTFVGLLSSSEFFLNTATVYNNVKYLDSSVWGWLYSRSISCSHFIVSFSAIDWNESCLELYVMDRLTKTKHVELVDLDGTRIIEAVMKTCSQLRSLVFRNCLLSINSSSQASWKLLSSVSFINCRYASETFTGLGSPCLEHVKIDRFDRKKSSTHGCKNMKSLVQFLKNYSSSITSLDIAYNTDDPIALGIGEACGANLRHLKVSIYNFNLNGFAQSCKNLVSLELIHCLGTVTDNVLISLAQSCPTITRCILDHSYGFHDEGVIALAINCRLEVVSLKKAAWLTDDAIIAVADHCHTTLKEINLDDCKLLTDNSVLHLLDRCSGTLNIITIRGCKLLSDMCHVAISMMHNS